MMRTPEADNTATTSLSQQSNSPWSDKTKIADSLAILFCLGLYLYHFFVIWTYAVDIPFWDEWAVLSPNTLSSKLNLPWLFAQHNEHRIVTDKLFIWLLYHWNGWDIAVQQLLNFGIYGILLLVVSRLTRKIAPQMPLWMVLAFVVFLLSPINHENHLMAFQSAFHFVMLFFLSAVLLLFNEKTSANGETTQSWKSLLAGSLCAILSIYSLSSGLVSCAMLLLVFGLWKIRRARNEESAKRGREWQQLTVVAVLLIGAIAFWFDGWTAANDIPKGTPFSFSFWGWFFSALSAGFGFESYSPVLGLLCLGFLVAPLTWSFWRKQPMTSAVAMKCTITLGILLVLLMVTLGRVNTGLDKSKTPRYVEFILVLIPLSAAMWYQLTANFEWRVPARVALWLFCFVSFWPTWSYFRFYPDQYQERAAGAACTGKYYATGDPSGKDWHCRSIAPLSMSLNERMNRAKELNVSFYRKSKSF